MILIPGKMPTRCLDCPFMVSRDNDDCVLQSAESNESFENWEQMKAGCPLIELPPHGDLFDRNHLEVVSYHNTEGMEDTFDNGVKWMLEYIDKLTPVIPAEGGANDG